jgi:DNA-binding FadR family transcriptional regulator
MRRSIVQLNLFPQIPTPHEELWEQLSETQRSALLEALAQLMAKAAVDPIEGESGDD